MDDAVKVFWKDGKPVVRRKIERAPGIFSRYYPPAEIEQTFPDGRACYDALLADGYAPLPWTNGVWVK